MIYKPTCFDVFIPNIFMCCDVKWAITKIIIIIPIFQAFCFALNTFIVCFRFHFACVCFWQRTFDRMQLATHCSIMIKVIKFNERPDKKANR